MSVFEKCLIPINRTAKTVTSKGSRFKYKSNVKNPPTFSTPLKTIKPPKEIENLTGSSRGNMTIIGYIGKPGRDHTWLAKCVCGNYETRNGFIWRKALRKNKKDHGCFHCLQHTSIIRSEYYKRNGFGKGERKQENNS